MNSLKSIKITLNIHVFFCDLFFCKKKDLCELFFIKKFYKETKGEIQIIGVGGVDSGQSAFEKITAGADAVQLYTGMVYKGPGIVREIKKEPSSYQ